jgi:hypothetical protein
MRTKSLLLLPAICATIALLSARAPAITVFEGARLIVGDGSTPIERSAFIVENDRFISVERIFAR